MILLLPTVTENENTARSVHLGHLLVLVSSDSLLSFEEGLAVLVELERGDKNIGSVDGELSLLSVGLLLHTFLNVEAPTSAVHGLDLTVTVLEGSTHDLDLVTLPHGDGSHVVLLS